MKKPTLWEDLVRQHDILDFEKFASESMPFLWRRAVKQQVIAAVLFFAGLAALLYSNAVLGAALLLMAVHYDQQASKSNMLLVLTGYHRAMARLLNRQATATPSPENGEIGLKGPWSD